MKRIVIFALVFLLVAGIVAGFAYFQFVAKPEMVQKAMSQRGAPPVSVTTAEAASATWEPRLPAIGTLVAVRGIDVAPQVGGVIDTVHFESGQDVEAGAPLIEIDDSVEEADLQSARATLKRANLDLERQRDLLQRGNTPKASYDAAIASRDTAAADVARIQAVIDQKNIEAPFDGRLGIGQVDPGEYLSPGATIVTLQQLDPIFADFPLPEQYLDRLKVGQVVEVTIDAFPQEIFVGEIAAIDAKVNQQTRSILVRARMPNTERILLPGMFANLAVRAGQSRQVVTVPRTAITYSLYGDAVYVVKAPANGGQGDGKDAGREVERRFVKTGETRENQVELTEGVKAGETVVSSGQLKLYPGAKVTVDNSRALKAPDTRPKE